MSTKQIYSLVAVLGATLYAAPVLAQPAPPAAQAAPPPAPAAPISQPEPSPAAPPPAMPPPPPPAPPPVQTAPPPPPPPEVVPAAPPPPVAMVGVPVNPLKVESRYASIRFGMLLQPQYEAIGAARADGVSENIFLRRTRVLVGGTLFKYFEYFFETDYPNLFKQNAEGQKASPGLNIQDAFVTFKPAGFFKVDAGFMLPPLAHNAVQGATTLYGWDYFQNSFRSSGSFLNAPPDPVGRDLGVQFRGLVLDDHLEYRAGIFQGVREGAQAAQPATLTQPAQPAQVGAKNFFRVAGRLQVNVFDAEPGYFYAGSYLGSKRILSFGASFDFQDAYRYWAVDGILDMPAGPGVVTAQVNIANWHGGTFIPSLPTQTAYMAEAGYLIGPIALSPILRFERLYVPHTVVTVPDETRYVGGLAYWPFGHNFNVKAFYSRISASNGLHDYDRFNLQAQLYFY